MLNRKVVISVLIALGTMLVASVALAADGAGANEYDMKQLLGLAAGLGISIAAFGGAMGQGKVGAAALDGIARNPGAAGKIFTPMILGLALIESLVIYSLIISFLLVNKIA